MCEPTEKRRVIVRCGKCQPFLAAPAMVTLGARSHRGGLEERNDTWAADVARSAHRPA